jgi:hypothetical protein
MSEKQRGRKRIEINLAEFQKTLTEIEAAQPDGKFPNRSALWSAFEATEWAKSRSRPLTGQVAMLFAKTNSINIQTPIGKRGRQVGSGPVAPGVKRTRKGMADANFLALTKVVPEKYKKVLEKARKGSLKAVIKLKCLDCCAYQQTEVALCELKECSLHFVRPYKASEQKKIKLQMVS